jgi:Replication factor A protein 3
MEGMGGRGWGREGRKGAGDQMRAGMAAGDVPPAPRINQALLGRYSGKPVTLVGKVVRVSGAQGVLEASDKGEVTVNLREGQELPEVGSFAEVLGTVRDGAILVERVAFFGTAFNMDNYDKLVHIAHERVPELFIE